MERLMREANQPPFFFGAFEILPIGRSSDIPLKGSRGRQSKVASEARAAQRPPSSVLVDVNLVEEGKREGRCDA